MTVRSSTSRVLPFLFALLLLMLQATAPLLHAHAVDDPLAAASSGVHLPGLEPLATATGPGDVASQRTYPLIEEAECCRESSHPDAIAGTVRPPVPDLDVAAHRTTPPSAVPGTTPACAPPPPRAPPPAVSA